MRRRTYLRSAAAGSAVGLAGCIEGVFSDGDPSSAAPPPSLRVDGRWLVDPNDERVVLRGVNTVDPWWGVEYEGIRESDYWSSVELATDPDRGWHANVLRVPVRPGTLDQVDLETVLTEYVDRVVDLAGERGAYVIVDYHVSDRYDTDERDRQVRSFWETVAPRYAEESHVLYELYAKPTEPMANGLESWQTWRETAQPWVDLVRDEAPARPILIGSPEWTTMTRFAPEAPFDGEDLVYTAHLFPSWPPDSWEANFGEAALEVPVFVSEWGYAENEADRYGSHVQGTTSDWGEPFREWLDGHANVSWCAFVFDSHWTPNMFDYDWNLLGGDRYMGEFTKQWLADRRYDHRPSHEGETPPTPASGDGSQPARPTGVRVERAWPRSVEIAWDEPEDPDDVVHYRVTVGDLAPRIVSGSEPVCRLRDAEPGTSYEVTVVAVGEGGRTSPASEPVTLTVPAAGEPFETIPRAPTPPAIDGSVDDAWSAAETYVVDNDVWNTAAGSDLGAEWRVLWDRAALYVLVEVTDDDVHVDSEYGYNDDHVALFLDLANDRGTEFDGENDFQIIAVRGRDTVEQGGNSVGDLMPIDFATAETGDGWRAEIAFPWSAYDVDPSPGRAIGIDVHVSDDEDGGDRDAKLAWYDTVGEAQENPSLFGTMELGE